MPFHPIRVNEKKISKKGGFKKLISKVQMLHKKSKTNKIYKFKIKSLSINESIHCIIAIPGLLSDGEKEG